MVMAATWITKIGAFHRPVLVILLCCFFLCSVAVGDEDQPTCSSSSSAKRRYASVAGNVTVVGLFDLHRDALCRVLDSPGVQRMMAALWAVHWINVQGIMGDTKLGFAGYSACSDKQTALWRAIQSLTDDQFLEGDRCAQAITNQPGFIGPSSGDETSEVLSELLTPLKIPHLPFHLGALDAEIQTMLAVLEKLKWNQVALLAENQDLEKRFHVDAGLKNVCVSHSYILQRSFVYNTVFQKLKRTGTQVIVFMGFHYQLHVAVKEAHRLNFTDFYWLVSGPTVSASLLQQESGLLPENLFFFQSSNSKLQDFDAFLKRPPSGLILDAGMEKIVKDCYGTSSNEMKDENCAPILNNDVLAVARSVTDFAERLLKWERCLDNGTDCTFIEETVHLPLVESSHMNISILVPQSRIKNEISLLEVGDFQNGHLHLRTEDLGILHEVGGGWYKLPRFRCPACPCLNMNGTSEGPVAELWHVEPWVAACGTLAAVGVLVALIVATFILVRLCRGDAMEGSQAFAILLLGGVMATYGAVVPFMLVPSGLVCVVRPVSVGLAYALLFSPMLARCFMLATSDADGLLSHISGLVQFALFFFMVLVQVALGVQNWWLVTREPLDSGYNRYNGVTCIVKTVDYVMALSYVSFLLALLLIISPCCVRNRRNYQEGLFFHVGSLASLAVWVTWLSAYFKLGQDWRQPILCLGLMSNATVILVLVFIPRVFKMVKAITLDTLNNGLRPVGRCGIPSLTDMNLRTSNAMIYETVNHAYAPEPSLPDGVKPSEPVEVRHTEECVMNGQRKPPTVTHL